MKAEHFPTVKGKCPECGSASLFLGKGGFVTCSILECRNPSAATDLLEGRLEVADVEQLLKQIARGRAAEQDYMGEIVMLRKALQHIADFQHQPFRDLALGALKDAAAGWSPEGPDPGAADAASGRSEARPGSDAANPLAPQKEHPA